MIQIYRFWLAFTKFPWLMIAYSFYPQMRDNERNNLNMTWFFQMSDFGHCWPILAPSAPKFCSKQTSKKLPGCCRGHGGMIPPDLLSNLDGIEKERCPDLVIYVHNISQCSKRLVSTECSDVGIIWLWHCEFMVIFVASVNFMLLDWFGMPASWRIRDTASMSTIKCANQIYHISGRKIPMVDQWKCDLPCLMN